MNGEIKNESNRTFGIVGRDNKGKNDYKRTSVRKGGMKLLEIICINIVRINNCHNK